MQNEPRLGCGAAIVCEGRILLVRRARAPEAGGWGLPGGKIDLFETAAAATVREIREELDIGIAADTLLCLTEQIDRDAGTHWLAPVYLVRAFTGTPRNLEPHKHPAMQWFALDSLPAPLTMATLQAIAALPERKGG